ncbi:MAG: hypothetical protein AAGF98_06500 [Cyanobacteria bacterium P01_H01_bin.153]
MPKPAKPQIRVYLSEENDRLLKALAGIKGSSVNAIVNEAIDAWLDEPEQKAVIQKFNLDQLDEIN